MFEPALTQEQIYQYLRDGYVHVSGLVPDEVAERAEAAMWRTLGLNPNEPETWKDFKPGHANYDDPDLCAVYTPQVISAAAQLGGGDPSSYRTPNRVLALNIFPQEGEWQPHGPHIDHSIKEHGHKTFPLPIRVASMLFLHDIEPHGGGTVVWPGSHLKIDALARSNPAYYESMWVLGREIRNVGLGEVVEIVPKRGDVVFYHILCAHSGSMNVSKRPRFGFNMKW